MQPRGSKNQPGESERPSYKDACDWLAMCGLSTPGIASKGNQETAEWDEEACTREQRKRVDSTTVAAAGGIKDNGKRALGGWADVYKVGNDVGELVF